MSINQNHRTVQPQITDQERMDDLIARTPKELACAFTASFLVSPLVSIIDKAIVTEITGIGSLMSSMGVACKEMVVSPRAFFSGLSFRLTFGVYFGTYAVANMAEALLDYQQPVYPKDDATFKGIKVTAASIANVGLLAWRDSVFAKTFGKPGDAKKKTPFRTIALFALRDSSTMAATFYAAPKFSEYLQQEKQWGKNKADIYAALSIPVITQFITAPVHIHALDYFSNQTATTAERMGTIKKELGKVCFARGLRVLPAFGLGSYSNLVFRETFIANQPTLVKRPMKRQVTITR